MTDPTWGAFVACDTSGDIVGYVIGSSENKFSYRTVKTGELNDMCVAPETRRSGIGRKLVGALRAWMKGKGIDRIYVSVFTRNSRAFAFYKAMGFREWDMGLEMRIL